MYDTAALGYETQPPRDDDVVKRAVDDSIFYIGIALGALIILGLTFLLNPVEEVEFLAMWSVRLSLASVFAICIGILVAPMQKP
jgi:hypothetical protein